MGNSAPWLVVVIGTSLDSGRRIVARCEKASLRSWFPVYRKLVIEKGTKRNRTFPLWPGYAFIQANISSARAIRGVYDLVRTEEAISTLSSKRMRAVRALFCERDGCIVLDEKTPEQKYQFGQKVTEAGSAFAFGIWKGMNIDGRHRVLYSLLGHPVEALVQDLSLRRYD